MLYAVLRFLNIPTYIYFNKVNLQFKPLEVLNKCIIDTT